MSVGVSLGTAHEADVTLRSVGALPILWERIRGDKKLARKVVALVFNHSEDFRVPVDCNKTLAVMIAAGNYDFVDPNINAENFPVKGAGVTDADIVLFHFGEKAATNWIEREMRSLGYRQARIEELLALGAAKPMLQTKGPIIALGSVTKPLLTEECNGDFVRLVPVLDFVDGKRRVVTEPHNLVWGAECSFAAVRIGYPVRIDG